ncbi:hypothetical protein B9Z55_014878 [Caenorhabditis nigoni]|uniref:Uncharacterized protein n=1 Tax=Caenorhabditis nigoni TaxID=1611254 RepID=A0A2G5U859_9PELO|nr:hypothetical protein B9Z55_014878 [Caenorhabditis nigoni]
MSEIEDLKNQIIQIEKLLSEEKDEVVGRDLEQTKADLKELVELMEEDEEGTSEDVKEEEASEEKIEDDNSTDSWKQRKQRTTC